MACTRCMCPGLDTNKFENSFEFTTHGIKSHTSTQKYDFSNRYGYALHVEVVQIELQSLND